MTEPTANIARLVPGLAQPSGLNPSPATVNPADSGEKFTDMLSSVVNSVNDLQASSAQSQQAMMNGDAVELHQVMIKAEEAGLSMDLLLEIRNRLVNAYNDVMRMPM
ncbi:MAG: flagellar hook-basal body complex protein FliE [candidate division Zixibacteria bacterium]|nr:flagellar hook-basal body complex protein FliE [candidate division Zixibacteria bacterium]